jgi:hypothetical protein
VRADRPLAALLVRCAVFGGLVLLAAVPAYVYVEPPWRSLVARLAAALVAGVALLELRRVLVGRLAQGEASALDGERGRQGSIREVPLRFTDLMSDVRVALRNRRHFEEVFWPRLTALARRPPARPPLRTGRGPSLASLDEVTAAIERQS